MTYDHWKTTDPADEWLGPEPEAEEEPEMAKTYDVKCFDLAEHFLQDEPELNSDANAAELAAEIQEAIEDWLDIARLNEQKRRAQYLGEEVPR